jgi:AraC-like DNA-binding protein
MHSRSSEADPLSEVLRDLCITGVGYARCELTSPWGLEFPAENVARFHFVVSGPCWVRVGRNWTELEVGDVVLLPRGAGHALSSQKRGRSTPIDKLEPLEIAYRSFRLEAGGGGDKTLLACCTVQFGAAALHPVLALMPPLLHVTNSMTTDSVLPMLLDAMSDEVKGERLGAATVMARLADVAITRVIRAWVETRAADTSGWLAAIRDPKVGRAIAAVHREPGAPWSVESLAKIAHTSRSVFSERFSSIVGMSPGRYVTRWRMHVATDWLREQKLSVAETAARLGYDSEASFSRAFKRDVGVPPSAIRRQERSIHKLRANGDL